MSAVTCCFSCWDEAQSSECFGSVWKCARAQTSTFSPKTMLLQRTSADPRKKKNPPRAAQKPERPGDRQQRGGKGLLCKRRDPLKQLFLLHNQWGHLFSLPHHVFNPCLVTPECLLSQTSLLVRPHVCSCRNGSPFPPLCRRGGPCSISAAAAWGRNARKDRDSSLLFLWPPQS